MKTVRSVWIKQNLCQSPPKRQRGQPGAEMSAEKLQQSPETPKWRVHTSSRPTRIVSINTAQYPSGKSQAQLDINSSPSVKELREKFESLNKGKQLGNGLKRGIPRQLLQSFHKSMEDLAKKPAITSAAVQSRPFQPQNAHWRTQNTFCDNKARFINVENHWQRSQECRVKKNIKKFECASKLNAIEFGKNRKILPEQIANKKSTSEKILVPPKPILKCPETPTDRLPEVISFLDNLGGDLCENCKETINKCIEKIKNIQDDCPDTLDTEKKNSRTESAVTNFGKSEKTKCKSTQTCFRADERTLMDEIVEEFQQKYQEAPKDQDSREFISDLMQTLTKINCNPTEKFDGSKNLFLNHSWSSEYDFGTPEPDYEWSKCEFVDSTVHQDDQHYAENCPDSEKINKSWREEDVYWVPVYAKNRRLSRTSTLRWGVKECPREKLPNISPIEKKGGNNCHFDNPDNFQPVNEQNANLMDIFDAGHLEYLNASPRNSLKYKKSSKHSRRCFPKFL